MKEAGSPHAAADARRGALRRPGRAGLVLALAAWRLWRRSGVMTDLEFYEHRYSGTAASVVRGFRALYLGLFFNCFIMGMVTLAACKIANILFGMPAWQTIVVCGILNVVFAAHSGLWGVLVIDMIQFFIKMTAVFAAAWFSRVEVGLRLAGDASGWTGLKLLVEKLSTQQVVTTDGETVNVDNPSKLPPVDRVSKGRMEVQAQGQNASKPEMLLFTMAKGKVRLLAAPRNRGWYVVSVTNVIPGQVKADDPRLPGLEETLAGNMGSEYANQLGGGMRDEVGVTRNQGNIDALKKRLQGVQ